MNESFIAVGAVSLGFAIIFYKGIVKGLTRIWWLRLLGLLLLAAAIFPIILTVVQMFSSLSSKGVNIFPTDTDVRPIVMYGCYAMVAFVILLCLVIVKAIIMLICLICRIVMIIIACMKLSAIPKAKQSDGTTGTVQSEQTDATDDAGTSENNQVLYKHTSRRQFISKTLSWGAVGATAAATAWSINVAKNGRVVRETTLAFSRLPSAFDGLRIAHLSDIHIGYTITRDDLVRMVEETNALKPDVVVITGDIGDGHPEELSNELDALRDLVAPLGCYYVTGNHEHMWDGRGWCDAVAERGIIVLDNEHRFITRGTDQIAICGAIDHHGDRYDKDWRSRPELALADLPENMFKLMLVHQPASVPTSLSSGADLVLVGHTHGGQFWPACYLVEMIHKYSHGLYWEGEKAVYVSCGTGYWGPPLRIGVPPEICLHTLKRA